MTQFKHTPGPWCFDQDDYQVSCISDQKEVAGIWYTDRPRAERLANAKLIASAPTLLQSLIECLEGVKELNGEYQDGWDDVIERAEQVIQRLAEQTN